MIKLISSACLMLISLSLHSQVTFYGYPEPVKSLNTGQGENYIYQESSGSTIYFSREKHRENKGGAKDEADIWMSELDSVWQKPKNLKSNDSDVASPLGVTRDGKYLLYNKVWYDKTHYVGGIFATKVRNPGREHIVEVPYLKNRSPIQTGSLSSDGRFLLLSLENNSGYGVDDLFVSFLQEDGSWSPVRNLGRMINTQFQEITPFLAADNRTLFFASNGRGGEGSFDLFKAVRLDETWQNWSEPRNLGVAVNTSGSETSFSFLPEGEYAYFVSTQNSDGYGDIKRIKIKSEITTDTVQMRMVDIEVEEPQEEAQRYPITFQLTDSKTGNAISGSAIVFGEEDSSVYRTSAGGQIVVPASSDNVSLEFKAPGYLSVRRTIDQGMFTLEDQEAELVRLEPLEAGNTITLSHVLFYRGTANFIEGSERELELVVEMMNENPEVQIFLKGHTDNVGNSVLNVQLSQARVEAVKNFLVEKGIAEERITGKGYGGSEPVASNETEESRQLNRRVEFQIRRD